MELSDSETPLWQQDLSEEPAGEATLDIVLPAMECTGNYLFRAWKQWNGDFIRVLLALCSSHILLCLISCSGLVWVKHSNYLGAQWNGNLNHLLIFGRTKAQACRMLCLTPLIYFQMHDRYRFGVPLASVIPFKSWAWHYFMHLSHWLKLTHAFR